MSQHRHAIEFGKLAEHTQETWLAWGPNRKTYPPLKMTTERNGGSAPPGQKNSCLLYPHGCTKPRLWLRHKREGPSGPIRPLRARKGLLGPGGWGQGAGFQR